MAQVRLMTAMITPYDENLEVNYEKAAEISDMLASNGSDGIVVCGTTGESPVLTHEEKLNLYKTVKETVGNKVQIWAGTGSNDTRASVELTKRAEATGVDGIMLVTPYYNKPTQEGLFQHFKTIAAATSLPVMLYNVPSRTSANLLPETVAKLAEIKNITAIKEASGNMDQVSLLKTLIGDSMLIYSGDDSITLPLMSLGASGVISIASHIVGKQIKEMIDNFVDGNVARAKAIHLKLFPLFKTLFIETNPIPVKEAMNMMGMNVGGFRLPLTGAREQNKNIIRKMLIEHNLME
ncbi:MAG TPA: 4-hydroxy-tetrahydrodipicolinate synthase [Syntrophomonadaceae bacterium]|nr:4-hydroxy-tetrahydrodipicolinate synthase [Syntrophomonadaceae bacterium]